MSRVPKLRFKEFNEAWRVEKFGELTRFQQGVQVDVELQLKEPQDGYVKFIRIENYTQGSQDLRYIPKGLAKNKTITEKEIAVVRYGATAGFIGRGFNGVLANNLFKLVPNLSILDTEYLFQYLRSHKVFSFFQSEMAGGAMPALSFGIVQVLKIPYPSKQEQEKIASFLSSVDTKIELLTKKKTLLEQYKKGVMQKIFSQEIRFRDDDGGEYPEWVEKKLGEIGKFQTSSIDKLSKEDENEVFLINYMDVYKHKNINNQTIKDFQVVTAKHSQIESCSLQQGDILFTPSSETPDDIGHSVVIFENLNNAVFSYHLMRFRPSIKIDILYSHYFCNIPKVLNQLAKFSTGSTRFTISVKSFSLIEIQLPCLKEQSKIANFLTSLDSKISQIEQQLEAAKQFKKALLQQMFV